MKNKLIICDLDGTLIDTTYVNYFAYKLALKNHCIEFTINEYVNYCNGKNYKEFLPKYVDSALIEDIHREKKIYYSNYLTEAKLNKNLLSFLKLLKSEYHISLVTTASRKNTLEILEYFKILNFFELIITQDDVFECKPNPEGFIMAVEYFKVKKENTIIFEDSEVGITAAYNAKIDCFIYKNNFIS